MKRQEKHRVRRWLRLLGRRAFLQILPMLYSVIAIGAVAVGCAATSSETSPFARLAIVSPGDGTSMPLMSSVKKSYFSLPFNKRHEKFLDAEFRQRLSDDGCRPEAIAFSWDGGMPPFEVVIVRSADGSQWYRTNLTERAFSLDGFEIATEYRWSVTDTKGSVSSGRFETEDLAPRFLNGGRVPNVRDLGGRVGLGGRRIRQGMVFRSAGLNENAAEMRMTEKKSLEGPDAAFGKGVCADLESTATDLLASSSELPEFCRDLGKKWRTYRFAETWDDRDILGALRDFSLVSGHSDAVIGESAAEKDGFVRFADVRTGTAFFVQRLNVDKACNVRVRVSGDWFWALSVNGCIIRNRLEIGNVIGPVLKPEHAVLLHFRPGENVIVAAVRPGSVGYGWTLVPDSEEENEVRALAETRRSVLCRSIGYVRGASRIDDGNRDFWLRFIGLKTDIDLRSDEECWGMDGSPLGAAVRWVQIPSQCYADIHTVPGRAAFGKVFRVFLDPANYPIDFHCILGQDRTGSVAFVLGALLGVNEDELRKDWEATCCWSSSSLIRHEALFNRFVVSFNRFPGATIGERVENYVLDLGFTVEDVTRFREIMLEK